ncbi:hypothetical protein HK102_000009 [Quaeritorhiza haematococci]|nr:hypothetical protein HK102_000009 [Quaeritorhiza haematococci]
MAALVPIARSRAIGVTSTTAFRRLAVTAPRQSLRPFSATTLRCHNPNPSPSTPNSTPQHETPFTEENLKAAAENLKVVFPGTLATHPDAPLAPPVNKNGPNPDESSSSEAVQRLLDASLCYVPTHGWTTQALEEGAKSIGYPSVAHGIASRGGIELVEYSVRKCTREMRKEMLSRDLTGMRKRDIVREACVVRLNMLAPYIKKWPEALALMALPQNAPNALKNLAELVDEIWFLAGDRSTDVRITSAGYELFMTQDVSPRFEDTFRFLDRRFADASLVGELAKEVRVRRRVHTLLCSEAQADTCAHLTM